MSTLARCTPMAVATLLTLGLPADAQVLPESPLVIGDGRLVLGGDVSATLSCAFGQQGNTDLCPAERGFFNYTDYQHSALRNLRIDVTAALRASNRVSLLGELRLDNADHLEAYALYVRVRPWPDRGFAIQAGRVPPIFGGFARRTYPADNPLIGYPLAYQYLTSIRPDAVPANADELLSMRGRGWLASYSVGNQTPAAGVPLVNAFRWDTGVQAHLASDRTEAALSVTSGTLANPRVRDDNSGKQVAGRFAIRATPGLLVGVSAARGTFITDEASEDAAAVDAGDLTQTAWGADVEYGRNRYLLRGEAILSEWRVPSNGQPSLADPLRAWSFSAEARYRMHPGLYVAGRVDRLTFSDIDGSARRDSWEANVTRLELGGGYNIQRNLLVKLSAQHNMRESGRRLTTLAAAQVVYWF